MFMPWPTGLFHIMYYSGANPHQDTPKGNLCGDLFSRKSYYGIKNYSELV